MVVIGSLLLSGLEGMAWVKEMGLGLMRWSSFAFGFPNKRVVRVKLGFFNKNITP